MSFKREGDDKSQLNILKKRRVEDLLSNFIPEDEAALLKNGRYTCLVCSYRPVFDTVDMLTVHRKGKRHLQGLKTFYSKKTQLKNEITKRRQQNYVQTEDGGQDPSCSAPLLERTRQLTHHALLKATPYSSCHRRSSTRADKPPASFSCAPSSNTSSKPSSEREEAGCRGDEPDVSSQSSSRGCAAEGLRGSREEEPPPAREEEPPSARRRSEMEHYLKLKSQGWLQDRSGRWVKDQNVEFDSDEEEPPPPPPPPSAPPASH